ncbi:MAG: arginine--tRNA ligase [Aquificaceae bacterium]
MRSFLRDFVYRHLNQDLNFSIERPKDPSLGHLASNVAFIMSKALRKNPKEVAKELSLTFKSEDFEVSAEGGFLNFKFREDFLSREFAKLIKSPRDYLLPKVQSPKRVLVEFVSANPTGPLHLGHARGAVFGDALCRILSAFGHDVSKEYYINDAGTQVWLLAVSVFVRACEIVGINCKDEYLELFEKEGYRGDYIKEIAKEFLNAFKSIDGVLPSDLIDFSLNITLDGIRKSLSRLGVWFDNWVSEREVAKEENLQAVIKRLSDMNLIYEKDGALWFKSSELGDSKDWVLRRSDGSFTYFANDIVYHLYKLERDFDLSVNIWGADHHGYLPRVKNALKALGAKDSWLYVLFVQMVRLIRDGQEVRMSKRSGEFITLDEVLDEVGKDALRFALLSKNPDTPLDIDIEILKKNVNENPVFYVQYAYARVCSVEREVLSRFGALPREDQLIDSLRYLTHEQELELIWLCLWTGEVLKDAEASFSPHIITYHLLELSSYFHKYYNHHRVITQEGLRIERLALFYGVKETLKLCLDLIGVSAPERM